MNDGKKEFIKFIKYLNSNKIFIPDKIKTNINDLIFKWRNNKKTLDNYYSMKNNHSFITGYIVFVDNPDLKKIWDQYIITASQYRVSTLAKTFAKLSTI